MNHLQFQIKIIDKIDQRFLYRISDQKGRSCELSYSPENKQITYPENNTIAELLKDNQTQLLKVMAAKQPDKLKVGFELNFVLDPEKDIHAFNDLSNIIIVDNTKAKTIVSVKRNGLENIHEIYTDGSYLKEKNSSGFAVIIKYPDGDYKLKTISSQINNSCLVELQAATYGFEMLVEIPKIRLITDSQYVRKGLSEWMINWKLNNWFTALGRKAKHIESWKKLDKLIQDKYIEIAWIKGHSGHFENTLCDLYAKDAAKSCEF